MKKMLLAAMLTVSMVFAGCGCGSTAENTVAGTESVEATEMIESSETAEMTESEVTEVIEETETTQLVEEPETEAGTETATVEEKATEYTFTELSVTKYAKSSVNVRSLPCTDGEKLGSLSTNQEVKVTGQCKETNWYRVEYKESTAYVSNNYLVDEKVVIPVASPADNSASAGAADSGSGSAPESDYTPVPESAPATQPDSTPTPDNSGSADNSGSNGSSGMTQEEIDEIKQEFEDNSEFTVEDDGSITFNPGEFEPWTDGYGEGTTITIQPVQ